MREAVGGAVTIQIIIIFLLIINSYLAFSVNYTKAFRVKNEIISIIEKNEGYTGDTGYGNCRSGDNACNQIANYLVGVAYNTKDYNCNQGERDDKFEKKQGGYCLKRVTEGTGNTNNPNNTYVGSHYVVKTFVKLSFPGLEKLLPIFSNVFAVKGETKTIYSSGTDTELGS
ncbi:MAG: hypothetical protein RSB99_02065 [Bacilli bacterium]